MSRIKILSIITLVVILFVPACNSKGGSSPSTSNSIPVEFASLGSLVSVPSSPQSFDVDENANQIDLGKGMSLQIPAGSFSNPTQLIFNQVDVAFDQISFVAKKSPFYVLSPKDEVDLLGSPLILEIPIPTGYITVVQYDGSSWQEVKGTPGQTVQLEIDHFSNRLWGYLEWRSEQDLRKRLAVNPGLNVPVIKMQEFIEKGDALTHAFFGVGESAVESQELMCTELIEVLRQFNTARNMEFPSDSGTLNLDLAPFLFAPSSPEATGGYFYELTEKSLETINDKVLASTTLLSPADVLKIAIEANGGNIPLGVLAAHNYLKNIKYQGVLDFQVGKPFPEKQGLPASHLASWREGSNITPAGVYDKMGPLYHIFAAMTAEVWFPTQFGGDVAINGEALLRTFQLIGDHPDMQKALADGCGENAGQWLRDNPPSEEQEGQPPVSSGAGSKDGSGSWHGAECGEAEGTYVYRWAVNLMKDPNTGLVKGTVKFHDCPDGGRVLYSVTGDPSVGAIFTLNGEIREGMGALSTSAPATLVFTFDSTNGTIEPNLTP